MKKIILGLGVLGIAISASAFTNAQKAVGDVYVQDPSNANNYILITEPYEPETYCEDVSLRPCSFELTTSTPYADELSYSTISGSGDFQASELEGAYVGPITGQ